MRAKACVLLHKVAGNGSYLGKARQHVLMVPVVKGYKGQLNVQQLCVRLWQPELNVPAIHHL